MEKTESKRKKIEKTVQGDDLNQIIQRMRPLSEKQEKIINGYLQSSYLVFKQKTQTFSDSIAM